MLFSFTKGHAFLSEDEQIPPVIKEQPKSKWDDEDADDNDVKESWEDEDEPTPVWLITNYDLLAFFSHFWMGIEDGVLVNWLYPWDDSLARYWGNVDFG